MYLSDKPRRFSEVSALCNFLSHRRFHRNVGALAAHIVLLHIGSGKTTFNGWSNNDPTKRYPLQTHPCSDTAAAFLGLGCLLYWVNDKTPCIDISADYLLACSPIFVQDQIAHIVLIFENTVVEGIGSTVCLHRPVSCLPCSMQQQRESPSLHGDLTGEVVGIKPI